MKYFLLTVVIFFSADLALCAPAKKNTLSYQHYSKGVELVAKKKYEEALKSFQAAIDLNPNYVASYIEFARSSALLGNRKIALEKLTAALQFAKSREEKDKIYSERDNLSGFFYTNDTFQQYQNGLNYIRLERSSAAIDALERAKKVEPDNVLVLLAYARALEMEERNKEALDVLEQGFVLNDRNKEVRLEYVEALLEKYPDKALTIIKPALADASQEKVALLQARALAGVKKNKDAIEFLREKTEKQPSWLLVHFWLGKFYSVEADGGWNARKHLMTFIKRAEPLTLLGKEDSPSPEVKSWKVLKTEAESLLERVNKSLE